MAGSLQRPPFKILIPLCKSNKKSTKYKSIRKNQKLHLLHAKTKLQHKSGQISRHYNSFHQTNPQRQLLKQLLKQLKNCQSFSYNKLLLLLTSSLSPLTASNENCCWSARENKKCWKFLTTTLKVTAINYVQQQVQQQPEKQQQHQQQLQLQLLQILNKVFKSIKFRKNLLNRKKSQSRELQLLYKKIF